MKDIQDIKNRLKKSFEEQQWKDVAKIGKKALFMGLNDREIVTATFLSYVKLRMYDEATKIVDNYMEVLNPFNFDDNSKNKYIQEIYNVIVAREIAKKIPKDKSITFIDVLFNSVLPVAKRLIELKENNNDKELQINYIVLNREREYQVRQNGIEPIFLDPENIDTSTALKLLRSKIVVLETYQMYMPGIALLNSLISGSIKFQIWHGLPIKRIGLGMFYDDVSYSKEYFLSILEDSVGTDYLVSPSDEDFIVGEYRSSFPNAKILPLGDPRLDLYFDENLVKFDYLENIKEWNIRNKDKIKLLLMFTFRDTPQEDALMVSKVRELVIKLFREGFTVAYKPHHESVGLNPEFHKDIANIVNTFGGINLSPVHNTYSMFRYFDALITDYSSVRFDFLVSEKPVILYRPVDLKRKVENEYWRNLDECFYKIISLEDTRKIIDWFYNDSMKYKRKDAFKKVHKYSNGHASEKIAENIYHDIRGEKKCV